MEIPHITSNIIPLSQVLKYHTNEAYNLLSTTIENLSMTKGKESDISRRKNLLTQIISIRQDFLKLYTLVKWSCKSKDIGKLIDLLNWFREQESYFNDLCIKLNELNSFSAAKLPNSDLITSLEVIIKGRPQLSSYNLIYNQQISSRKVLSVLKDLNLVLISRLALSDNIPHEFLNNYEIKDGRINFILPFKYFISITVGNDEIIENSEDYYKSPFFCIDFKFLFNQNLTKDEVGQDSTLHRDDRGHDHENVGEKITISPTMWMKFEKIFNQILLQEGLSGLYQYLNNLTKKFKYELILKQLKSLDQLKWKSLKFKYTDKIIINYWGLTSNIIEIFINDNLNIEFKWFKNNQEIKDTLTKVNNESFNVENLVTSIISQHCELLISRIFEKSESINLNFLKVLSPFQILMVKHKVIITIDYLIGKFYITEPNAIESTFLEKINGFNYNNDESLWINYILKNLIDLKLEIISNDVSNKLLIIEWITNKIIKLKDSEILKIIQSEDEGVPVGSQVIKSMGERKDIKNESKIRYFRCKNWPSSWFLIVLIDHKTFNIKLFVSRIKSIKGEWKLQWVSHLKFETSLNINNLTFDIFKSLNDLCTNKIIDNMIMEELNLRKLKYIKYQQTIDLPSESLKQQLAINNNELILIIFNDGTFLPIKNSSNCLFLKIKLINNENKEKLIELKIISELKNHSGNLKSIKLPNITINDSYFEIKNVVNLDFNNDINSNIHNDGIFHNIFKDLNKFNHLIKLMNELNHLNINFNQFNNNNLRIHINDVFDDLIIELPNNNYSNYSFSYSENTDVKILINFINKSINATNVRYGNNKVELIGVINYFNLISPILKSINNLKHLINNQKLSTLSNGLHKLYLNTKFYNLNNFELLFNLNSINPSNPKKIVKSKIILNIKFKLNKFKNVNNNLDLTISLIDNLNLKNIKYKKLFELIYKKLKDDDKIINLNYDFIVDIVLFDKFLQDIGNCFINYIENDQ